MTSATIAKPSSPTNGSELKTTTIVVGVDGTEPSWSAVWWACGEARRVNGRVIAVYVTTLSDPGLAAAALAGIDAGQYILASNKVKAERSQELAAELEGLAAEFDVRVDFLHLSGDAAQQLLCVARDTHADVLAVGRSTHLRHRLAGSLSSRLAHKRDAPIIVIVP